jgi:hypothetical protein
MEDVAEPTSNEIQMFDMSKARTKNVADVSKAQNGGCGGANM